MTNKNKKSEKEEGSQEENGKEVKGGDTVKIEYEGRLDNGEVFDSSDKGEGKAIEFTVGDQKVIKGLDEAVRGMKVGEEKEFSVGPEKGFGQRKEGMTKEIPKDKMPKEKEPKEGMMIALGTPDGRQVPGKIVEVGEEKVTIDLNHPLAGKDLDFKIKLVDVQ